MCVSVCVGRAFCGVGGNGGGLGIVSIHYAHAFIIMHVWREWMAYELELIYLLTIAFSARLGLGRRRREGIASSNNSKGIWMGSSFRVNNGFDCRTM